MESRPESRNALPLEEAVKQAYAHWNARNQRQAEELILRVLAKAPAHPAALNLLSLIAYSRGNLDHAIASLEQACKSASAPATWLSNLGEMLRQRGRIIDAVRVGRQAVERDPKLAGARGNLGIALQESGQLEESRRVLEEAARLEPNSAELRNNLGNTLKRMGLLREAHEQWTTAMRLKPDYAEPHSNMALLLIDEGKAEHAVVAARRAIELNPRLADAYINLASALAAVSRYREALATLDTLLGFAPRYVNALTARALALKNLDRFDEAVAAARAAVSLAPESGEAHVSLGQMLQAAGNFDEALAAYDRAASLPGNAGERALINRAVLYMEHGRSDEARDAFERATVAYPRSASAWFNRSDLVKFSEGDRSLDEMTAALESGPPRSQTDRMLLHFALGKAWLDLGDSDKAFKHLDEGNRLKRSTIHYDPDGTSRAVSDVIDVFTADLLARRAHDGFPSDRPVFVVGMPRSGTTLIEQVLAAHPAIYGAGELRHVQHVAETLPGLPQSISSVSSNHLAAMGETYINKMPKAAGDARFVVDKMPANFFHVGLIRLILPNARIIHSRRTAADTCLSCYSKLFQGEQNFSYDQTELGRFYRDYERLMAHWRGVLPASHFIEVDYEAMVDDLETEARRMIAFLGLEWDEACLSFHARASSVKTASVNQVRQPIYKSSAGRWRKHEAHLQPLLEALRTT